MGYKKNRREKKKSWDKIESVSKSQKIMISINENPHHQNTVTSFEYLPKRVKIKLNKIGYGE